MGVKEQEGSISHTELSCQGFYRPIEGIKNKACYSLVFSCSGGRMRTTRLQIYPVEALSGAIGEKEDVFFGRKE